MTWIGCLFAGFSRRDRSAQGLGPTATTPVAGEIDTFAELIAASSFRSFGGMSANMKLKDASHKLDRGLRLR